MSLEVCNSENQSNLYIGRCAKLPNMPKTFIETSDSFKLTPAQYADAAALKTALQDALVAAPFL
jgi:hypothetical protein